MIIYICIASNDNIIYVLVHSYKQSTYLITMVYGRLLNKWRDSDMFENKKTLLNID